MAGTYYNQGVSSDMRKNFVIALLCLLCLMGALVLSRTFFERKQELDSGIPLPPGAHSIQLKSQDAYITEYAFRVALTPERIFDFYQGVAREAGWESCIPNGAEGCLYGNDSALACYLKFKPLRVARYKKADDDGYVIIITRTFNWAQQETAVELHRSAPGVQTVCSID